MAFLFIGIYLTGVTLTSCYNDTMKNSNSQISETKEMKGYYITVAKEEDNLALSCQSEEIILKIRYSDDPEKGSYVSASSKSDDGQRFEQKGFLAKISNTGEEDGAKILSLGYTTIDAHNSFINSGSYQLYDVVEKSKDGKKIDQIEEYAGFWVGTPNNYGYVGVICPYVLIPKANDPNIDLGKGRTSSERVAACKGQWKFLATGNCKTLNKKGQVQEFDLSGYTSGYQSAFWLCNGNVCYDSIKEQWGCCSDER